MTAPLTLPETAPLVVVTAGGTGGHVFPAAALADALGRRRVRLAWVTDERGSSVAATFGDIETHHVRSAGLAGRSPIARLTALASLAFGAWQARRLFGTLSPAAVVGFGGYASIPAMVAGLTSGAATVIHEQNAVLGRANRFLAARVTRVAVSTTATQRIPVAARDRVVHTGMPVRPAIQAAAAEPFPPFGATETLNLLILGGSQGARVMSDVVPAAIVGLDPVMRQRLRVVQQCRPEDLERARAVYAEADVAAELATFYDDLPDRLATAHLVISRAGASTVADLTTIGRPAILVPLPSAIDDHQTANAKAVADAKGGWLVPQDTFTVEAVTAMLADLLGAPEQLAEAAGAAVTLGRPDAADRLAELVCGLIAGHTRESATSKGGAS